MNEFPADRNLGSDLYTGDLTHEDVGLPARAGVAALGGLGDSAQGAAGWRGVQSARPCLRRDGLSASSQVEAGVRQEGDAHGAFVRYVGLKHGHCIQQGHGGARVLSLRGGAC